MHFGEIEARSADLSKIDKTRAEWATTPPSILRDATIPQGIGQFGAIQAVAPWFGVELRPIDVRDAPEIERAVTAFARSANGGLIVSASALTAVHRDLTGTNSPRSIGTA